MKIGELARRTGVSVRSLRYYEEQGLIQSQRTPGGQRPFDGDDAVSRVDLVQLGFAAGMTSRDVLEMLPCIYSGTTTPAMVDRLVAERRRIDDKVSDLIATRDRLDGLLDEARARLGTAASA